jgi:hypothetical protein
MEATAVNVDTVCLSRPGGQEQLENKILHPPKPSSPPASLVKTKQPPGFFGDQRSRGVVWLWWMEDGVFLTQDEVQDQCD